MNFYFFLYLVNEYGNKLNYIRINKKFNLNEPFIYEFHKGFN